MGSIVRRPYFDDENAYFTGVYCIHSKTSDSAPRHRTINIMQSDPKCGVYLSPGLDIH